MSGLLESRDYFVKCLGFVLLFGFISLGAIGGCGNNDGDGTQALTERDFFNNPNLSANPEEGIVVVFLEPTDAPEAVNLTGELGFDVIPLIYTRTLNHTFCFEDDNDDSVHFMILRDSDGEEVLSAGANEGCVTEVIEAGDYEMVITHGEHVDEQETVFIIFSEDEQVTKRDEFNQKEFKTANGFSYKMERYLPGGLVKIFESISNVFSRRARAQTVSINNTTRLINNACPGCNLMNLDLSGADLTDADLSGANLTDADLTNADLSGADLTRAVLTVVTLGDTMFDNAAWCDSLCTCGANSIDTCVGCASIDTCTALNACEVDCDDGSMCTKDICDPTTLACTHEPVVCDDGNSCTTDSCDPEIGCDATPEPDGTACGPLGFFIFGPPVAAVCKQGECLPTDDTCTDAAAQALEECIMLMTEIAASECVPAALADDAQNPCLIHNIEQLVQTGPPYFGPSAESSAQPDLSPERPCVVDRRECCILDPPDNIFVCTGANEDSNIDCPPFDTAICCDNPPESPSSVVGSCQGIYTPGEKLKGCLYCDPSIVIDNCFEEAAIKCTENINFDCNSENHPQLLECLDAAPDT